MERRKMTFRHYCFLLVGVVLVGLASCSKETVDNMGRDTAQNIIRANKWSDVVKTTNIAGKADVVVPLAGDGEYIEFKSDGYAYVYLQGRETKSYPYTMPTSKKMIFDGVEYDLQENIIQTVAKFTLVNSSNGITTTISFKRR